MPARSKSQANLMAAAEHGASFPLAKQLRQHMTAESLHDFAATPTTKLPTRVTPTPKPAAAHPNKNLGHYLHPKKTK